jgi:acetoacetate decarboxylase
MNEREVRNRGFAMPLTSPAYPPGPYRFINREYLIITYRTDPEKLRAIVSEPLAPCTALAGTAHSLDQSSM